MSAAPAPEAIGLFEMVLEVDDLAASEAFNAGAIGLRVVERWTGDRPAVWLALGRESFLGLWPRDTGGEKAIHRGRGGSHVHFAIRVPRGSLAGALERLRLLGHDVEDGWEFGPGNLAIYLDDPDGNVVELTERATFWDGTAASTDRVTPARPLRVCDYPPWASITPGLAQPMNTATLELALPGQRIRAVGQVGPVSAVKLPPLPEPSGSR